MFKLSEAERCTNMRDVLKFLGILTGVVVGLAVLYFGFAFVAAMNSGWVPT